LSLKDEKLSMYTLDGRMRFQLDLKPEDRARFQQEKLREIVLSRTLQGYQLAFWFSSEDELADTRNDSPEAAAELPEYLIVSSEDTADTTLATDAGVQGQAEPAVRLSA